MRANFIHIAPLIKVVLAYDVPGDLAELGVWHGTTFVPLAELARMYGRTIHAVDSFCGASAPTARDAGEYPAGALSVGGSTIFRTLTKVYPNVIIHEGEVPGVLRAMAARRFAFVHLDLDQYAPTLAALEFLWPRMSSGGILCCHDWIRGRTTLASGAISDWSRASGAQMSGVSEHSMHCWFVRAVE